MDTENAKAQVERLKNAYGTIAEVQKMYYENLINEGFSKDDALKLLTVMATQQFNAMFSQKAQSPIDG
jgi:hypothetical protein